MNQAKWASAAPPEEREAGRETVVLDSRDHFEVLGAAHEIDWRFLLPDPHLGRIAYFGKRHDHLFAALECFAASVEVFETSEARSTTDLSYDGVVIGPGALDDLAGAARLVRAGGWLYAELPAQPLRRWLNNGLPASRRRALLRLGFVRVETHWHFPDFRSRRAIVPLSDPSALRIAFARGESTLTDRLRSGLARLAAKLRLFESAAQHVSVIGVMPRDETSLQSVLNAFVGRHRDELGLVQHGFGSAEISSLLVTPPDVTSSHVIALLGPRDQEEPSLVAKLPRLAGYRANLVREAANLDALHRAWPAVQGSAPEVLMLNASDEFPLLLETAVSGRPLDPARVRRDPVGAVDAVVEWLSALGEATKTPAELGWYRRLIEEPLERLDACLALDSYSADVSETLECLAPLRGSEMFAVFEHGDPAHPNLILTGENQVQVIDWERSEPRGLPAQDVIFFLSYIAFARRRAQTAEERNAAFDEAFRGSGGWARSVLALHADRVGLDRALLAPLIVACWGRYTAGFAVGLLDGVQTKASGAHRHFVDKAWETAIWRHAVEHVDELMWPS
jgi:hypothetical protein